MSLLNLNFKAFLSVKSAVARPPSPLCLEKFHEFLEKFQDNIQKKFHKK